MHTLYFVHEWGEGEMTEGGFTDYLFVPVEIDKRPGGFRNIKGYLLGSKATMISARREMTAFDPANPIHVDLLLAYATQMHNRIHAQHKTQVKS